MNRWPSASRGNEPLSQLPHTTPPAAGEKAVSPSASPQRAHEPSSGAKPAASSSFIRNASDCARVAAAGSASSSASWLQSRL